MYLYALPCHEKILKYDLGLEFCLVYHDTKSCRPILTYESKIMEVFSP